MNRSAPKIVIEKIDYHRNGVGGEGFHVVLFAEPKEERRMAAVVFPTVQRWNGRVAVFNRTLLANDTIEFGINSWRGDVYEAALRAAIAEWDSKWEERLEARAAALRATTEGV